MSDSLDEHTPAVAIPGLMSTSKEDGIQDNLYFCTMKAVSRRPSFSGASNVFGYSLPPFVDTRLMRKRMVPHSKEKISPPFLCLVSALCCHSFPGCGLQSLGNASAKVCT